MPRVYVAGPLFNRAERTEQADIARSLELVGFTTYLPQRDGFDANASAAGITDEVAAQIFQADVYQLFTSDLIIANVNGIEPDSGTVVEIMAAYAMNKPVVLYRDDIRTDAGATVLNPMVLSLRSVPVVKRFEDIVPAVQQALQLRLVPVNFNLLAPQLKTAIVAGANRI